MATVLKMLLPIRFLFAWLQHTAVFLSVVIPERVPVYKWPRLWRLVQQEREREITRMANQLTMQGKLKRRIDTDGKPIYWPMEDDNANE